MSSALWRDSVIIVAVVAVAIGGFLALTQYDNRAAVERPRTTATPPGTAQPSNTAPPDLRRENDGDVYVCTDEHYDPGTAFCLADDTDVGVEALHQAHVVWPPTVGGTHVATIQVMQKDAAGVWQVVHAAPPNAERRTAHDGSTTSETLERLFLDAHVPSQCNATYLIRVVNADNHRFGQAALMTSC